MSQSSRVSYLPRPTNADQQKRISLIQQIREQHGWSEFPDDLPLDFHHSRAKSPQFELIILTAFLRLSKLCSDYPHTLDRLQSLYSSQVQSGNRVSLQSTRNCLDELEAELAEDPADISRLDDDRYAATDDEEDTRLVKEEDELDASEQLLRGRRINAAVIHKMLEQIVSLSSNSQYIDSWDHAQLQVDDDVEHVYHAFRHPGSDAWTLLFVDQDSRVATCYDWFNDPGGVVKVQEVHTKLLFDFDLSMAWDFEDDVDNTGSSHGFQGGLPVIIKVLCSFTTLNGLASIRLWREVLAAFIDDTIPETDDQDIDVDMASDSETIDTASEASSIFEPESTHSGIEKNYETADTMRTAVKNLITFISSIRVNTTDAVPIWTERRRILLERQEFQRECPLLDCTADSDLLPVAQEAQQTDNLLSIVNRSLDNAVAARKGLRRAECMLHHKLDELSTVMLEVAASVALSEEAVQAAALNAVRAREKLQAAMSTM